MHLDENCPTEALVSICIPSYNARRFITETLASVLASHHQQLDVVVSDDASSDGTPDLAESIPDPRVRVFRNTPRLGPVPNWNRALAQARGDYVGLLNHDDLCGPFWIASALHALRSHPEAGWVASAYKVVDASGRTLRTKSQFPASGVYGVRVAFMTTATLNGLGPGFIARRHVLDEVGHYDESAGPSADNDLFLRLAVHYPLYYSTCPHNAWRLHDHNLTHSWTQLAQVEEGVRMLVKAFSDPQRPSWVDECRESSLRLFKRKCLRVATQLELRGETEQVRQVRDTIAILSSFLKPPLQEA